MPAGLGTLFVGLLLIVLAFVEGDSVWKSAHQILFGLFGCGSFVLGAAVCYLAILYTRGQDLLMQVFKLLLGLIFASGTVIVFSDIPADLTAAQMIAACYQNGANAWLGGGVLGTLLGGNLLLLCGRPAANLVMAVLALCASLYIFDITPAECWQWLCNVGGGVHEKGVAVYEQNAARRAERLAARQAEEDDRAEEPADDYDDNFDEEDVPGGIPVPGWLSGVFSWGHKVTKEMEGEAEPAPVDDSLGYEPPAPVEPEPAPAQPAPAFEPVKVTSNHPRAAFDIDLGPDTSVSEGGSEPIEPIIIGPGGTFGQDPLQKAPPRAIVKPVVPDAVETAAEDFFVPAGSPAPAPVVNPTVPPAAPEAPAAAPAEPVQPEMPVFQTPTLPTTDEPVVPVRVSAENAVAMRSEPDEDGWISITSEPVEEKDLNTLVAAAMEKPAAGEQAAATAPAEEPEVVETFQYQYPSIELFEKSAEESDPGAQDELKANAQKLVDTLESFGVRTRVLDISRGPSVTRYEVQPMAGVKISRITSLADDIALNLAAGGVRIEAPIPNKAAIGIEVPNKDIAAVPIREIIDSTEFTGAKSRLSVALGKDISGRICLADLAKMPHLLIAGTTGSGKSVCVNSILMSILYKATPDEVKLLLIDPKMVEFSKYKGIPHLLIPVVSDAKKAAGALAWAVNEMLQRYKIFSEYDCKDIDSYNSLIEKNMNYMEKNPPVVNEEGEEIQPVLEVNGLPVAKEKMSRVVIAIDELADLMMAAPSEVEDSICRLAQMARAAGMHLILATQRPTVNVITGLIKANVPSRISLKVSSNTDSRTILDTGGGEKLIGRGDMLFSPVGAPKPIRVQGCYASDEEIEGVTHYIKKAYSAQYNSEIEEKIKRIAAEEIAQGKKSGDSDSSFDEGLDIDSKMEEAIKCVIEAGQASTSLLQRRLKVGYARAGRMIDDMEQMGVVGPHQGSKPRDVLMTYNEWLERRNALENRAN